MGGYLIEFECHRAFLVAQDDKNGHREIPKSISSFHAMEQDSYNLRITAVLEVSKHNPYAFWETKHLLVCL